MTTAADLIALAERCEAAQPCDRQLAADILVAVGYTERGRLVFDPGGKTVWVIPDMTSSIDAAVSIVPNPWWTWIVGDGMARLTYTRPIVKADPPFGFVPAEQISATACANGALALSSCALRARAMELEQ